MLRFDSTCTMHGHWKQTQSGCHDEQRPGNPARIVSVSSRLHYLGKLDPDDMQLSHQPALVSLRAYANSKLAQVNTQMDS